MFTENELVMINDILRNEYVPKELLRYEYQKKTDIERERNKYSTLILLEALKSQQKQYTPEDILNLRIKSNRVNQGLDNYEGIYIIHNYILNKYYVGKSKNIFERVHKHFDGKNGNAEVFEDYSSGFKFTISTIKLRDTPFKDLNELEDNAIRAYNALYPNGYNRVIGNIIDRDKFVLEDHRDLAKLFVDRIKLKEDFKLLVNDKKRMGYIYKIFKEYKLISNSRFQLVLLRELKQYQKMLKGKSL